MKPAVAAEYLGRVGVYGLVGTAGGIDRLRESGGLSKNLAFEKDPGSFPRNRTARPSLPGVFPYRHGEDDLVMLCHTSGTTGPPKAVTFGHRQFFRGKRHRLVSFPDAGANRMLSALPQTHSAGISYLMTATLLGLPTLVMADSSGEAVHEVAGWFRPTLVVAFPQTYAELAGLDLSPSAVGNIHTWINTGDSAHEAHIKALIRHGRRPGRRGSSRAGSRFIDGLGSSETGMALFRKVSEPEQQDYDRCVGKPVKVVESATVLDPDGPAARPRPGGPARRHLADPHAGLLGQHRTPPNHRGRYVSSSARLGNGQDGASPESSWDTSGERTSGWVRSDTACLTDRP